MTSRNYSIDLMKLFASFLIVILHSIKPGEGIQEFIYLLGCYGIPLFFLVNGYLRCKKPIGWDIVYKFGKRYLFFISIWSLLLAIPYILIKRRLILVDIFIGALIGDGLLFHLWFLISLITIYIVLAIVNSICGWYCLTERIGRRSTFFIIVLLMTISFFINLVIKGKM